MKVNNLNLKNTMIFNICENVTADLLKKLRPQGIIQCLKSENKEITGVRITFCSITNKEKDQFLK